ncbi:hypothetical protein LOZ53_004403 [Ophidiomyces ophidiicola]|uniref:Uncharacterized protein n=1 Tax=Ophidiomyces ophidiicola TaxID=1387563 RepID=A0ACB8UPY7_9EURO|nr:uncharacterized protein LOZ57_006612 [Ophidiomyces ophidiicola]KAI1905986.1 hypothetical protein LOZ64_006492 [Ophidiomyces ophidiicola]KAI1909023.1 hypothetical protein LOZ61_005260 [Ophidiomyces ophidiicola]KAI1924294.1 hypothetical protein LOZ60_004755 [Ophidiomyces ophidiicola]KAI1935855.1 hypothetical protein LOZ62_005857 [Ophidiomyces ophidiicola]KAI1937376.1 hypothetical protein LOZ57_006612 [Ophidiomyces ophidiicola]
MRAEPEIPDGVGVLSFSIKHEFIVKVNIPETLGSQALGLSYVQNMRSVHERIIEYLRRFGVRTNDYRAYNGDLAAWTVEKGVDIKIHEVSDPDHGSDDWGFFEVRLGTPVYPYFRPFFFEIDRVLTLMKDGYVTILNSSCSLTVHVGRLEGLYPERYESFGFSIGVVQTVLEFVWKFEAQINALHPQHRIWGNPYCITPSRLLDHMDSRTISRAIWRCKNMAELYDLWEGKLNVQQAFRSAPIYGIRGLTNFGDRGISNGTMRFSQHQGTLDFEEVKNWVWFIGCLVQLSLDRGCCGIPLNILGFAERQVKLDELSAREFIRRVGMNDQYKYYKQRLAAEEELLGPCFEPGKPEGT